MINRRTYATIPQQVCAALALALVMTSCGGGGDSVPPGFGPADLVVRRDILASSWIVRLEDLAANQCSAVEDGVTAGTHSLLRFSVSTSNLGTGDVIVGDPNQHVAANDGLFELAT